MIIICEIDRRDNKRHYMRQIGEGQTASRGLGNGLYSSKCSTLSFRRDRSSSSEEDYTFYCKLPPTRRPYLLVLP